MVVFITLQKGGKEINCIEGKIHCWHNVIAEGYPTDFHEDGKEHGRANYTESYPTVCCWCGNEKD